LPRFRLFFEWFAILVCTVLVFVGAQSARLTARFDNQLLDFAAARSAGSASTEILIVAIDDRSLVAEGQWPWDRRKVAALIDRIEAAQPRLIVADVLFSEPSTPEADAALARSIAQSGRVALPYAFTQAVNQLSGVDLIETIPDLRTAQATSGHVVLEPDPDGLTRRLPLWFGDGARRHPHLQVAAYRALHGKAPALTANAVDPVLPLRPAGAFRTVSASSVLRSEVPADFMAGKIVMIGASAPGLGDNFPVASAAGGMMAGVELQANLLQALDQDDFVRELPAPASYGPGLAAILLLFLGFWRLRPALGLALALGLVAALLAGALALTLGARLWFAPGAGLLALIVAYPLWGWRRLSAVSRFLDAEALQLSASEPSLAPQGLGGFDSVAKQIARLDFLVDEVSARRDFLRRVFEAAPDAMLAFDGEGRLQLRNAPARELFAGTEDGLTFPELIDSTGGELRGAGTELHLSDGRTFTLSKGQSAESGGLQVMALTDITATRQADTERRAMLEFLSHDMRSPQVAIIGLTGAEQAVPDRIRRIERHARRTLALADSFVELARLAEARLEIQAVELGALLGECVDNAWSAAKARNAQIDWHPGSDQELWIETDPMVLGRAVDNLIGNALKYGREAGTVRIAAGLDPGVMEVWLTVSDDGPGLPTERRTDPFVRFGARGATTEHGSGLGLAFVKAAIERLGGRISWQTSDGEGTQFTVHLRAA
jgi:CHASE2 domain-containing sensor protein/signal transduction histidine kinase